MYIYLATFDLETTHTFGKLYTTIEDPLIMTLNNLYCTFAV